MKPIIGINLDIEHGQPAKAKIQTTYLEAIQRSGGIPILLAPMPDEDLDYLLATIHGILFIGGDDYSPSKYGEEIVCPSVELIHPLREDFDLRLIKRAMLRPELPILGICGGCQLLNIGLGGSLIQDIKTSVPETQVNHSKPKGFSGAFITHPVVLKKNSRLEQIYGLCSLDVPTSHHQAVKELGQGLKASAHAEDGVIEAVESTDRPFAIGVQWHPERDFDGHQSLFAEFISQSSKNIDRKLCEQKR